MTIVWLSHILDQNIPLYGGERTISFEKTKSMADGDSCNTTLLCLPSHAGSHVDAPRHFFPEGKTIDKYPPSSWIFTSPLLVEVDAEPGRLIAPGDISGDFSPGADIDFLLIKTGFEARRWEDVYWQNGPGLSPDLSGFLTRQFPALRAIGVDFLSISSLTNREEGRVAHRSFLEREILLFEDLSMRCLQKGKDIAQVIALPLRFTNGDGAPCSVLAWLDS